MLLFSMVFSYQSVGLLEHGSGEGDGFLAKSAAPEAKETWVWNPDLLPAGLGLWAVT